MIFVVDYRYADAPEAVAAAKPEHRAYLAEQLAQGSLLASGPLADSAAACLIVRADGEEEVQDLIQADPINRAGLLAGADVRQWLPNLGPFA
ncbi:MAG: YciI family protein [Bifidobacteriaceae bacterium]|nr:YciI family protein [Bifidobacteriaceae bacterium]